MFYKQIQKEIKLYFTFLVVKGNEKMLYINISKCVLKLFYYNNAMVLFFRNMQVINVRVFC